MVEEILKLVKHMNKVEKIENSHFKRLIIITGLIHTQHALKIQDKEVIINKIFMNENINFYMNLKLIYLIFIKYEYIKFIFILYYYSFQFI